MSVPPVSVPVGLGDRSYTVHIGKELLQRTPSLLPFRLEGRKIFILFDRTVEAHAKTLEDSVPKSLKPVTLGIEGGEKAKCFETLEEITGWLLSNGVERNSVLFVVGGGVLGDLGGFAASIVLRGIDFVQVPTTLLAQVDSSVGGKTGINTDHGKNLIGAFYQPASVICDIDTLMTLPQRELKCGYAEIVKYGLLGSRDFYDWLEMNGRDILALSPSEVADAIETSCRMKADIVAGDERERAGGRRALLNLGHTFGHAIEAAGGYDGRVLHGEAVSIGLVLAYRLGARMGLASENDAHRVESHLLSLGMKTKISDIVPQLSSTSDELVALMQHDKKASGGKIGFILPRGIGEAFQTKEVDLKDVRDVVEQSIK